MRVLSSAGEQECGPKGCTNTGSIPSHRKLPSHGCLDRRWNDRTKPQSAIPDDVAANDDASNQRFAHDTRLWRSASRLGSAGLCRSTIGTCILAVRQWRSACSGPATSSYAIRAGTSKRTGASDQTSLRSVVGYVGPRFADCCIVASVTQSITKCGNFDVDLEEGAVG